MQQKTIEDIVLQSLGNDPLNADEQLLLQEWLNIPENMHQYRELKRITNAIYTNGKFPKTDLSKAWKKLSQRIVKPNPFLRLLPYAAAVIIIGLGLFLLQPFTTPTPIANTTIPDADTPNQIVLTLSNGERIILSDNTDTVREANGATISNQGHQLVYTANDSTIHTAYNTIRTPRGAEYKLILADGSTVWLNAESEITYPVAFNGTTRELKLKGEAYFDVTPNPKRPFIVHTDQFNIRVTGTEFNVRVYAGETESATLAQGGIQLEKGTDIYQIKPGQQAYLENHEVQVKQVDLKEAIAWRYNAFSFNEVPLEQIMNELSRWYDIHVFYASPNIKGLHFTAWFRRNSTLTEVITILQKTGKIHIELKGKTVTVTQKQ